MSSSSSFLTSSLGRKYVMAATGLFLVSFLLVHVGVNAMIFVDPSGDLFNRAAHFMGTNWVIRTMEFGLFAGIILHVFQAAVLTTKNKEARPVAYNTSGAASNSKWYSRSMGLLGTLVLMFLIIHIKHFWVKARLGMDGGVPEGLEGMHDMFGLMRSTFSELWIVILYVLSMVSLAYHLLHGFKSGFQSLGLNHPKYNGCIEKTGVWFSILVPALFAAMPLYIYFVINK